MVGAPGRILTICTPAGNIVVVELLLLLCPVVVTTSPWLRVLVIVVTRGPAVSG